MSGVAHALLTRGPRMFSAHRRVLACAVAVMVVLAAAPWTRHAIERALHIRGVPTGSACNQPGGGTYVTHNTVAMTATPDGEGYWLLRDDGGIFPYGDAPSVGTAGNQTLGSRTVAMAATPSGHGFWLVERRGMVWAFGDAACYGGTYDTGATDIVGIAASASGHGYWLVEQNGGMWPFGDAGGYGCIPCQQASASDVIGMARTQTGGGYWIVEANGGTWPYGDALGLGAASNLAAPISAVITPPSSSQGYFLIGADGGVFPFGSASGYLGSLPGNNIHINDVTAAALTLEGQGVWFARGTGPVLSLGDAPWF